MTCCLLFAGMLAVGLWLKRRALRQATEGDRDPLAWRLNSTRTDP